MKRPAIIGLTLFAGVVALGMAVALSTNPPPEALPFPSSTITSNEVEESTTALLGQPLRQDDVQILAAPLVAGEEFFGEPRTCAHVQYANVGSDPSPLNLFNWKLQTPDGVILTATLGGTDNELPTGEVAAGGNAEGDVCFKTEVSDTGHVLTYEPLSFTSDKLTWNQS